MGWLGFFVLGYLVWNWLEERMIDSSDSSE